METVTQGYNATSTTTSTGTGTTLPYTMTIGTEDVKTFTQAEVDKIVGERLSRQKQKYEDYDDLKEKAARFDEIEEQSKSELQKATERADKLQAEIDGLKNAEKIRTMREKVALETGLPVNLLSGDTEEACKEQAKNIIEFAKPNGYPQVKDGGEILNRQKMTTKQQFAQWAEQALN